MKSFSIGLVILSAFLMVGSVPPKPRDEYDEGLRNAMESCSGSGTKDKSEIKMLICKKYPTRGSYCDQYLDDPNFPNFSADDCRKKYDDMYEKCCGGLESGGPRDDDVGIPEIPLLRPQAAMECSGTTGTKSEIKIFCKKYPTSSSYCDPFLEYPNKFPRFSDDDCRKEFDYVYDKCCGGLEWWVILLIVMAVVEVIGVIIGLVACRRGKANNGGVGQMNPNYAAGAYGQAGNVYGPPGNVVGQTGNAYNQPGKVYGQPAPGTVYGQPGKVYGPPVPGTVYGQPGKVYGQTQPVGALQHVYFEFNSTSASTLIHLLHNYFFSFSMN
jgi:hypothetical protein